MALRNGQLTNAASAVNCAENGLAAAQGYMQLGCVFIFHLASKTDVDGGCLVCVAAKYAVDNQFCIAIMKTDGDAVPL